MEMLLFIPMEFDICFRHQEIIVDIDCAFAFSTARDKEGRNILFYCLHATKRHQECLELSLKYGAYQHNVVSFKLNESARAY